MRSIRSAQTIQIATCESDEAWVGGNAGFKTDAIRVGYGSSLRLGSNGSLNTTSLIFDQVKDLSAGKYYEIWVLVENPQLLANVQIFLVKDTGTANYASVAFTDLHKGWNRLSWHESEMSFTGDFVKADIANIKKVILGVQANSANTTYCRFSDFKNIKRVGELYLEVDDGLKTIFDQFMPIVESYGFKFAFYVLTARIDVNASYENSANLKIMQQRGHVIGLHNHEVGNFTSENTPYIGIIADWQAGITRLASWGIVPGYRGLFHYASSNGALEPIAVHLQPKLMQSGRPHIYPSSFDHTLMPYRPWDRGGYMYRPSIEQSDPDFFLNVIQTCADEQLAAALVYHHMEEVFQDDLWVTEDRLRAHCQKAKDLQDAGLLRVLTCEDSLDDYTPSRKRNVAGVGVVEAVFPNAEQPRTLVQITKNYEYFVNGSAYDPDIGQLITQGSNDTVLYEIDFSEIFGDEAFDSYALTVENATNVSDDRTGQTVLVFVSALNANTVGKVTVNVMSESAPTVSLSAVLYVCFM